MLYCPKCQQTYEEGSQRFCSNDGGRLMPVSNTERASGKTEGVFTNLLSRNLPNPERDEKLASIPRFVRAEPEEAPIFPLPAPIFESDPDEIELELDAPQFFTETSQVSHDPPAPVFPESDITGEQSAGYEPVAGRGLAPESAPGAPTIEFESTLDIPYEPTAELESELEIPETREIESPFERPLSRIIRPQDIPSGRAELGDRQVKPAGRDALTWNNPDVMLGQTVKGRYNIIDRVGEDESGVSYLAEDKIVTNKMVLVRVLMDEDEADEFTSKIYAEERISFAHINHPNVVGIIDSGELQEGKSFVVTEYVDGQSAKEILEETGQFAIARTARVIRQTSYALSEMHQNGILHRNLKPGSIILAHPDGGSEQVKITGFGFSGIRMGGEDLVYKAPEVLDGQVATFSSDVFSLAVIAYEMLTNRHPFSGSNAKQMLKSQREGMMLNPTNLRLDVPSVADKILEKAMSINPVERYPKARDFGDALFNALTTILPWDPPLGDEAVEIIAVEDELPADVPAPPVPLFLVETPETSETPETAEAVVTEREIETEPVMAEALTEATEEDPAWTKRSPEPPKTSKPNWILLGILAVVLVGAGIYAWLYAWNRPPQPEYVVQPPKEQRSPDQPPITDDPNEANLTAVDSGEVPPPARSIQQPANTTFYQNSKQNLRGDLARNFVAFTLFYPNDWKVNESKESNESGTRGKFLDISRNAANGKTAEQMLMSYYESRGTISADEEKFPQFVAETNETLKKLIPSYQMLSQGKTMVNGWWAYEVKFQGGGTTDTGEKLIVWGRRLFIPAARPGVKNGFEITMLATSFSQDVKSVDDVGKKGGLATVLYTFEPGRSF
jgi:eukaryotic-like serine/threonine-protein kinase